MRDLHCTHLIPTMQWSEHFSTQGLSHLDFPFKERETLGQNLYTSLYQVISLFPCQNETGPFGYLGTWGVHFTAWPSTVQEDALLKYTSSRPGWKIWSHGIAGQGLRTFSFIRKGK